MAGRAVRVLGVLESPYRGGVERTYADVFYLARVLNAQLRGFELLLRGPAVLAAAAAPDPAPGPAPEPVPEPAAGLRDLLGDGVPVYAQSEDLARFDLPPDGLVPGVRPVSAAESTAGWAGYESVWFL